MTVSVVIPTFNRGALIEKTLASALNQTFAPLEIIVIDDGSTDETPDWIEAHYGDKIQVLRQKNGGVARARNRGWRTARGEWIAFLDHDDEFQPQKLERLLEAARPEIGVIYGRWREILESGEEIGIFPLQPRAGEVFDWFLGWNCPLVSMSVPLVRRELLQKIGGFDPRCVPADDWDLWLRLSKITKFGFVDEITTDYSIHDGQQRLSEAKMFGAVRRVLRKHPRELARRPLLLWWILMMNPFLQSAPIYRDFKGGASFFPSLRRASRAHPLALLAPQWSAALVKRLLR